MSNLLGILKENFGDVKVKGKYAYIHSPFNQDDRTPSCAVILEDGPKFTEGFFKDFSTGRSGNIYALLGIDHDYNLGSRKEKLTKLSTPVLRHHMSKFDFKASTYLLSRGIPIEVQEEFKVYGQDDRVMMPVFDRDGYFIYDVTRITGGKGYMLSGETGSYPAMLHTIRTSDTIFICESMIDAFTFIANGLKAISLNGVNNYSQLKELLKNHFGRIILALDPDEAGINSAKKIQEMLVNKEVVDIKLPFDVNETWMRLLAELDKDTAHIVFTKLIERLVNNKKLPCMDCGKETLYYDDHGEIIGDDYYEVRDDVWLEAVPNENYCGVYALCKDCLSKRLGRPLRGDDFTNDPINFKKCGS